MTEQLKTWLAQNAVRLIITAFLVGVAWATLHAEVKSKADRATVEQMAADIRDIKVILCDDHPADSACRSVPRRAP